MYLDALLMKKKQLFIIVSLLFTLVAMDSCRLFDKELEQDRHIANYRHQMLISLDSIISSKERISSFEAILDSIEVDKALITPRKKNELIKNCYSFISIEYCEIKQFDKAIEFSNTYIELDSTDARGYYNRGVANQGKGIDSLALKDYLTAISLKDDYTPAYYNAAIIYENMKNSDKALELYSQAITLKPAYLRDVYINRGNVYQLKDDLKSALNDYSAAIKIDTTDVSAYCNRGNVYTKLEQYDKAISDYTHVMRMDSTLADAYNKRAYAYELKKSYDEALADYRQARKLDESHEAREKEMSVAGIERVKKAMKK